MLLIAESSLSPPSAAARVLLLNPLTSAIHRQAMTTRDVVIKIAITHQVVNMLTQTCNSFSQFGTEINVTYLSWVLVWVDGRLVVVHYR